MGCTLRPTGRVHLNVPRHVIATECGIARQRTPELVRRLLEIHAGASNEPAAKSAATNR